MITNKYTLYLALIVSLPLVFFSCSDDLMDADAEAYGNQTRRAYSAEQIKLQRLGYAYNAAGNVMDDSSFSAKPIINMTRLEEAEKKNGPIVSSERRHYTSVDIFSGSTTEEVGSAETEYTINEVGVVGCGKYFRKNTTFSKTTWTNVYKAHMFVKHIMATQTIDAGMLRYLDLDDLNNEGSVLEADFRQAVSDLVKKGVGGVTEADAVAFSEKYGTHLVVSSNLGGMIELQMQINRDSCVEKTYVTQQISETILGKRVSTTSNSQVISEIPKSTIQYQGVVQVKGGVKDDCDKMHRTFDEKRAAEVRISDADYTGWATRISIEPSDYNASFVSGRFLPLYNLFETLNTRQVLRQVYKLYMKKEAPDPEIYEPAYGVIPVAGNYGPDVRVVSSGTDKAAILCQEYVPSIRSDKPVVVAYPLLKGVDGEVRPFFFSGLFVGDESHRPGRVIWKGSASIYTPSDSIFYESDSTAIHNLFDEKTHVLKNVYFYWNNVHATPCYSKTESPKAYTSTVFSAQPATLDQSTTFAKVASTFWSVRPVKVKTAGLLKYWEEEENGDQMFKKFKAQRYSKHDGVLYQDESNYYFALLDGGENIQRAAEDNDINKRWTAAVSKSMNALGLHGYLPSVEQSKSITKMLGNRMDIFYNKEYSGRNMLGLDWPTGFWVISHPDVIVAAVPEKNDGQGMPIVTDDAKQVNILRLSGSGTDLLLDYPNYIKGLNYSNQMFFKFFPIYITIDKF